MIYSKLVCLFAYFCILPAFLFGQSLKGRVTDEKGFPIPYASLYLVELQTGVTTDDNGHFQTTLKQGRYTLEVSSIGYSKERLQVDVVGDVQERNIVLHERIYQLGEVVIGRNTEDPAYSIMRQVIAKAPFYRNQLVSFHAGTYLKGTGKLKSIPVILKLSKEVRKQSKEMLGKLFVLEEQREVTYAAPNKWTNRVKAYANSFPENMRVDIGITTVNLYTPNLFDKVSPLSAGAFSYYRYQLEGSYAEGDHVIDKIRIIPRNKNPRLLSGYLYVVDDLSCLSSAELVVEEGGLKANIRVVCSEVSAGAFLPTSTSMACVIDVMGIEAEASYLCATHYARVQAKKLPANGQVLPIETNRSQLAVSKAQAKKQRKIEEQIRRLTDKPDLTNAEAYKLYKLTAKSIELADTLKSPRKYERPNRELQNDVKTDSLAGKKDSLYWADVRSVPLRPEELESYARKQQKLMQKDSLNKSGDSLHAKKKTIAGKVLNTWLTGQTFTTKDKDVWLKLYDLTAYVPEYNFVDGLWVGAKLTGGLKLSEKADLNFTPRLYYATARKKLISDFSLTLNYAPRRAGNLWLKGGRLTDDYNGESGESRLYNSAATFLFSRSDVKFYEKSYLALGNRMEIANGLQFSASLEWQRRNSLQNFVSKAPLGGHVEPNVPENANYQFMPVNNLLKSSFELNYTPAQYYRIVKGRKVYEEPLFPTFSLRYERAFPMSSEKYVTSYHRLEFGARQAVDFGMFNRFSWNVNAGLFRNAKQLQFPDLKHFASTRMPLTERNFDTGFFLIDNYRYATADRWAQAHMSWHMPYLLVKQLPFLRKKSFDEALHLHTLVTYKNSPYSELGYSVGFRNVARVGVFAGFNRLKYSTTSVSVSLPFPK